MKTAGDFFAGAGGWSEGAAQAGVEVVVAVNHWACAVNTHAANHPKTDHRCQDLTLIDTDTIPSFDLGLFSPACQGHAKARGKERPHHDAMRSTAWCVVSVAEAKRPAAILVENVPEFLNWSLYPMWLKALEALGYNCTANVLDAADFGVPQNRERFFLVGRLNKPAIKLEAPKLPHVPASSFLDFNTGNWQPIVKPGRAAATLARIENGRRDHGRRFLLPFYGNTKTGRSIDRPIGTITTHDRFALVDGDRMRMVSIAEAKHAMSFDPGYMLTGTRAEQMKQLGNAVCPTLARGVLGQVLNA